MGIERDYFNGLNVTAADAIEALPKVDVERTADAEVDIKKIIKDMQGNMAGSNEDQMKAVQLLKGLATSDEAIANKFMKALDKETTRLSKEILGEKKDDIIG